MQWVEGERSHHLPKELCCGGNLDLLLLQPADKGSLRVDTDTYTMILLYEFEVCRYFSL